MAASARFRMESLWRGEVKCEEWVNDGGTGAVAEYGQVRGLMGEWGIRGVAGHVYRGCRSGCG